MSHFIQHVSFFIISKTLAITLVSFSWVYNNPVLKHLFAANLSPAFPSKLFSSRSLHSHTLCLFFQLDTGGGTQGETAEPHRSPPVRPTDGSERLELRSERAQVTLKALKYACLCTNASFSHRSDLPFDLGNTSALPPNPDPPRRHKADEMA